MSAPTIYLETFGCQMNELDSSLVTSSLRTLGYRFTPDASSADVILYNTCSVREQAEQKVWSRLGELTVEKRSRPGLVVGVLGCLAEREGEALVKRMPVVDILCGPGELDKLPALLDNAFRTRESLHDDPLRSARQVALQGSTSRRSATLSAAADNLELLDLSRSVSPTDHSGSAYVRITRGCNKFCTYCVVPFTRGAEIHRPPDHIVDECRRLAAAGVREITLLGQTVNHYRFEHDAAAVVGGIVQPQKGRSFAGGHRRDPLASPTTTTFADLLRQVHDEVPQIDRLRFVTSYPRDFGDDVLEAIRDCPRICRYLHVPAQSGSDDVLKRMNRGYTAAEYLDFIDRARAHLHQPEIGRPLMLAGDIIVGFPGETDEDFEKTAELLEKVRYKNCFIFKYSPRPGTVAFDRLPDDVPDDVKRRRNARLLALQQRISDEIGREQIGRTFPVLVEGPSKRQQRRDGLTYGQIRDRRQVTLTVGGRSASADPDEREPCAQPHEHDEPAQGACSTERSHVLLQPAGAGNDTIPAGGTVQLAGRTDGDLIVFFDCNADSATDLIGTVVHVRIDLADRLSLFGTRV